MNQKLKIVFKHLSPQISLNNVPVLKMVQLHMRLTPNLEGFFGFGKIKQKLRNDLLNCFKKIPPLLLFLNAPNKILHMNKQFLSATFHLFVLINTVISLISGIRTYSY